MSTTPSPGSAGLASLPPEVLLQVIEGSSRSTLAALCRTCHRLRDLANPALYRSVLLRDEADCRSFALALESASHKDAIESLKFCDRYIERADNGVIRFMELILLLPNLHSIAIDSYHVEGFWEDSRDSKWESTEKEIAECISQSKIEHCMLFPPCFDASPAENEIGELRLEEGNGDNWSWGFASGFKRIMYHPSLKELTLRRFTDYFADSPPAPMDALDRLSFYDCDVDARSLGNFFNVRPVRKLIYISTWLQRYQRSLDAVDYWGAFWASRAHLESLCFYIVIGVDSLRMGWDLREFKQLKYLGTHPALLFSDAIYEYGFWSARNLMLPPALEILDFQFITDQAMRDRYQSNPKWRVYERMLKSLLRHKDTEAPNLRKILLAEDTKSEGFFDTLARIQTAAEDSGVEIAVLKTPRFRRGLDVYSDPW